MINENKAYFSFSLTSQKFLLVKVSDLKVYIGHPGLERFLSQLEN